MKKVIENRSSPAFVFPEFSKQTIAASHASNVEPPDFRIEVAFTQASLHTRLYFVSSMQLPAPVKQVIDHFSRVSLVCGVSSYQYELQQNLPLCQIKQKYKFEDTDDDQ